MVRSLFALVFFFLAYTALEARAQDLGATINKSGTNVTGVTFRVWAPNASAVRVAGEFNNWNSAANSLTNNPADGVWTGAVSGARPGQAYKYVITTTDNQALWRKDPRGRAVRTLPEGSVPAVVTNSSSPQASVVYDKDAFDWTGDTFVPPEPKDIVMYELHIGTFNDPTPFDDHPATFDDAIQRLDYLKALGVNMIALMPVSEFSGRHSWGYNPSDPFAIEETYGGPDAFKRFVKAAHLRGMAVQVDVVHNHYGTLSTNSATWQSARLSDLENFDGGEPYFYNAADEVARPGISKTKWGPRPRYSDGSVRSYIKDNIKMYLDEYKVWALRWDSPRNITGYQANPSGAVIGDPNTPIPEAVEMMEEIHAEIASKSRPNSSRYYSIAEDAGVPGGYTGHWEISYHDAIFSRLLGAPLQPPFAQKYTNGPATLGDIKFRIENKEDPGFRVVFLENHDKCGDLNSATDGQRLAHDFDTNNPTSVTAKSKTLMAAAATLTAAGVPMLWMGQEQLADGDFNDKSPLDWNRAAQFPGIVRFHRDLVQLRRSLPALRNSAATPSQSNFASVVHSNETSGVLAFRRSDGSSPANDVLVAMNFAATNNTLPASALAGGFTNVLINSRSTNYDAQLTPIGPPAGSTVAANSGVALGPWSVLVLAKTNVALPVIDDNGNGIDDGIDMLAGTRAALAGDFNDWDTVTPAMKWDPVRRVYWYVARFNNPGTNRFKAYTTGWAPGEEGVLVNNGAPATWEITYSPSNHAYTTTNLGAAANGMPERWQLFWFGDTNVAPVGDADGDGWTNQEEFLRGSDPVRHEAPRFAVVGQLNGWNWPLAADTNSSAQMRYFGHGLWKYFHWLPIGSGPDTASFKIAQGPSSASPNWGAGSVDGFARYLGGDLAWLTGTTNLEKWQSLTYNERTGAYRIGLLGTNAPDADSDGMADEWENFIGLNPFLDDRSDDLDRDSVLNGREFARGSRADDPSDHFAAMFMPGDAFPFSAEKSGASWEPSEGRVAMKWNTNEARWQALRYIPRPRELQFKFAANASWTNAWNWTASGNVPGIARKNTGTNNIRHAFSSAGYHIVSFDEHSGRYSISAMPTNDTTGTGVPDYWEWFHGLTNPTTDTDADGVAEIAEYRRGSDPRRKDRSPLMNVVRDLTANYFESTTPMRWNNESGMWEVLIYAVTKPSQMAKFVAGNSWSAPNWGDSLPVDGIAESGGADIAYSLTNLPAYLLFQFEEVWGHYRAGAISPADEGDGLPDDWAAYHGISNALADADGDGRPNIKEFRLGMNPLVADGAAVSTRHPTMSVAGSFVNGWDTAGVRMTLIDDFLWMIDRQIGNTSDQVFKFNVGNWSTNWGEIVENASTGRADGSANIRLPNLGSGTYRIIFNEATLQYFVAKLDSFANRYSGVPPGQIRPQTGIAALNEYLFGGTASAQPSSANFPVHSITNGRLRLDFIARIDDAKLSHIVETSTDLSSGWSTNGVILMSTETSDFKSGLMRHIYEAQGDGHLRRFFRIRTSLQP